MKSQEEEEEEECCPKFNPEQWNQKTFIWDKKPFIKESIPTLFHIPFPPMIGKKVTKMHHIIKEKKVDPPLNEWLLLFHDPSAFKSELLMSVTEPVDNAHNTSLSGEFEAMVFDGNYNEVPKFIRKMDPYLAGKEKKAKDYFVHYAYCPKCAKKYEHNYMIIFAEVE